MVLERADVAYPNQQVAVILYSGDFARKQDLATRFMAAYLRVRDYNDAFTKQDAARRAEVIEILAEYTTIKDRALYEKVVMPGLDPNGKVNVDSLKRTRVLPCRKAPGATSRHGPHRRHDLRRGRRRTTSGAVHALISSSITCSKVLRLASGGLGFWPCAVTTSWTCQGQLQGHGPDPNPSIAPPTRAGW